MIPAWNLLSIATQLQTPRLKVSGTDFTYDGKKVFLSGSNIAYNNYGYDFGNGDYDGTLEKWVKEISNAGGNSIRVFLHGEGFHTPIYGDYGYVTKCDKTGDFENDVLSLLNVAKKHNVLVVLVMWNGSEFRVNLSMNVQYTLNLIWDDSKLDTYISNCLNGLIEKIKGHPALLAFEAMNEPEGSVRVEYNTNMCYNTNPLENQGPNWTNVSIPMQKLLRFIGRQNQAVRAIDPGMLTTLGSWSQLSQNDEYLHSYNYYKDTCLNLAAGGTGAHIDFYQMHSYAWKGSWTSNAPFTKSASNYKLDKPLVIGEFSHAAGAENSLKTLFEYAYTHGYNGAWSWHYAGVGEDTDSRITQQAALGQLKDRTENGIVNFNLGAKVEVDKLPNKPWKLPNKPWKLPNKPWKPAGGFNIPRK